MQSWAPAGDRGFTHMKRVADAITALSNGRLLIETFPAGAIVPAKKEHEGLQRATIDLSHVGVAWLDAYGVNSGLLFSQWVNGLTGVQLMFWDFAGGGRDLGKKTTTGLEEEYISPLTVYPAEVWMHSKKEVKSLADLKGMKMRVGTPLLAEMFTRLGMAPVVLSGAEVYEAAKRGVIDAFEYVTPSVNFSVGFHEVADYVYLSPVRAPSDAQHFFANKGVWNKLDPSLRNLITTTAEAYIPRYFAESIVVDNEALQKMKAYGNKVLPIPKDIDEELGKIAVKYYDELAAKDALFKEVLESQRVFKALAQLQNVQ